jgi:hypothetical protein
MSYRNLELGLIEKTAQEISSRIQTRFQGSGLGKLSKEVVAVAAHAATVSNWLRKPNRWLRVCAGVLIVVLVSTIVATLLNLSIRYRVQSLSELLQAAESAINDIVFIGLAILFLISWENRIKRKRALEALHELRSLAHIIDMHQLTKDPEVVMHPHEHDPAPGEGKMTPFQLTRYLDYCSDLLAVIGKIAAVYVENFTDPVTLAAVTEVENLTNGLSRKIWQKIMILERAVARTPNLDKDFVD